MGKEVGEGFGMEGTHVCLQRIHTDVRQKPSKYCKVIILQLKKIFKSYFFLLQPKTGDGFCLFFLALNYKNLMEFLEGKAIKYGGMYKTRPARVFKSQDNPHSASSNYSK